MEPMIGQTIGVLNLMFDPEILLGTWTYNNYGHVCATILD